MTTDGGNLPTAYPCAFNLEVITDGIVPNGLPAGYQGVAVLSDNGQTIDMAYGNWALDLTGDPTVIGGTGQRYDHRRQRPGSDRRRLGFRPDLRW